ncbi:MAG: sugar ABC transporter substrate-binding protein [Candidatus Accumulibacter sp.]|jgi:inositol transport system substrate-binding protein|nr:sugar ABC transporter substrate-binding protein [Accumulibacter sp.]
MKPIGKLALCLASALMLASASTWSQAAAPKNGKNYRIAYIARAQGDSFAAWLADAVVQESRKFPDTQVTVFDGQSKNEVIASHIENAVTNKYDLILLQPFDSEAQLAPVKDAVEAGVKVVTVNNRVNDPAIPAVDADPIQQAEVNAQLAIKQVPQNAKVVVLMGPAGNMHSDKRREGWQKFFFDQRKDVKIVGEQIANWNKDEGMRLMEDWLQANPKIDAIISMNDNMAAGALEAVKGSGEVFPFAYGVDGTAEACLMIKDGSMTSTSLQSAYALAELSMKMSHDLLTGKEIASPQYIVAELITRENADKFIQMHKELGNIK